jgi:hypothetical protein
MNVYVSVQVTYFGCENDPPVRLYCDDLRVCVMLPYFSLYFFEAFYGHIYTRYYNWMYSFGYGLGEENRNFSF